MEKYMKKLSVFVVAIVMSLILIPTTNTNAAQKPKLNKKSATIYVGKTVKLKYIRKPIKAKDKLLWKSSKPRIVKILKNGRIKGIKKGKSTVTLYTNTGKKARISVTVK